MWPWEHLAIGYVVVAVVFRLLDRQVDDAAALAVLVGSQFPDLVDKPLAWSFGVLPNAWSVTHSVFVAVPLSVVVYLVSRYSGYGDAGVGFGVAYLLHLPADALYNTVTVGDPPSFEAVLWPLVSTPAGDAPAGLLTEVLIRATRYRSYLAGPAAQRYILLEIVLLASAFILWHRDGYPGLGLFRRWTDRRS